MPKESRLTEEQEQIRMRGLRILARMIVTAHMMAQSNPPSCEGEEGEKDTDPCDGPGSFKKEGQDEC